MLKLHIAHCLRIVCGLFAHCLLGDFINWKLTDPHFYKHPSTLLYGSCLLFAPSTSAPSTSATSTSAPTRLPDSVSAPLSWTSHDPVHLYLLWFPYAVVRSVPDLHEHVVRIDLDAAAAVVPRTSPELATVGCTLRETVTVAVVLVYIGLSLLLVLSVTQDRQQFCTMSLTRALYTDKVDRRKYYKSNMKISSITHP